MTKQHGLDLFARFLEQLEPDELERLVRELRALLDGRRRRVQALLDE